VSSRDISAILGGWPYESGQINVRKIRGLDGRVKIQMRVDLGLLQMETDGRPDGQRPFGAESLLAHHLERLRQHTVRNGTELGYELSRTECRELRDEAAMYYQRYLALFVLEDFEGVERDTQRNLSVLDLCRKFAGEESDRYVLEQYRPYIVMMNTRAKALRALEAGAARSALAQVEAGLKALKEFFASFNQPQAYYKSSEVRVLRKLRSRIKKGLPPDPMAELQKQLRRAVDEERYEEAARLRDRIRMLDESASHD
jgi:hypothetical protein